MQLFAALLVYLVVALILGSVAYWLINKFAPEPVKGYLIAAIVVIGAIVICYLLMSLVTGSTTVHLPRAR